MSVEAESPAGVATMAGVEQAYRGGCLMGQKEQIGEWGWKEEGEVQDIHQVLI